MSKIKGKFVEADTITDENIRLRNNQSLDARNAANTADIPIIKVNASDIPELTGNTSAGGFKVTNVGTATVAGDAVPFEQAVVVAGTNPFAANQSMGNFLLKDNATPVDPGDAANKAYVDSVAGGSNWHKYTVTYTQLAAAALTNSIELFELPAKGVISKVVTKHTVAFGGGTITAYTVSVGIVGNTAKYSSAFDVFQALSGDVGQTSSVADFENFLTPTSILIEAISTGDNLDQAMNGEVEIYVYWEILP